MSQRDMILVERVTDGDACSVACPMIEDTGHGFVCIGPGKDGQLDFTADLMSYRRCPQCLATPSAVVLTEEATKYIQQMDAYFERMGTDWFRNGLRLYFSSVFQPIEGVGR